MTMPQSRLLKNDISLKPIAASHIKRFKKYSIPMIEMSLYRLLCINNDTKAVITTSDKKMTCLEFLRVAGLCLFGY